MSSALPDSDVYTLDARGTGASGHLRCLAAEDPASDGGKTLRASELGDCLQSLSPELGQHLHRFGITTAARDLAHVIELQREPSKAVDIYADSAGALWLQRLLVLHPDIADAVVMEAYVPVDFSAKTIDETAEEALQRLLQICLQTPQCSGQLPDPGAYSPELWSRIERGHCAALNLSVNEIQRKLFEMLASSKSFSDVPALLSRLDRCSATDLPWLTSRLGAASKLPAAIDLMPKFSEVIYQLITASELWDDQTILSEQAYQEHVAALASAGMLGHAAQGAATSAVLSRWPRYADPLDGVWPNTAVPMLILHGELDPRIHNRAASSARDHYKQPQQHYVSFPHSPHDVLGSTMTRRGDCASTLLIAFLRAPRAPLDTSCLSELSPITW